MAIEFNCPYCTAAIRVPDSAAGKRGTCPKCVTKLLVPVVKVPDSDAVTEEVAPVAVPPVVGPPTVAPTIADPVPITSGAAEVTAPIVQAKPTKLGKPGRKRKKRKRRNNSGRWVLGSLVALALLVAVLLFAFYQPTAKLEGTLTGTRISAVNIAPGQLNAVDVDASPAEFAKAVASLKTDPLVLTSELVRTEISGSEDSIVVSIDMTTSAEFISVDISDPMLKQYVSANTAIFGQQKRQRLRTSATQLARELAQDGERRLTNPSALRNAVALNLMRNGFGFVVDGAAGKLLCPCVYESGNQVWFAVPAGTTSFVLRGRTIDGLGQQFPGRYQVTVNAEVETVTVETHEDSPEEDPPAETTPAEPPMDTDSADASEDATE